MISVDEYHYSKRKTLAVCIDRQGRVIVRAPKGYPQRKIEAFLSQKEDWITRHQQAKKDNAIPLPTQVDGYVLPYLGGELRLVVEDVKRVKEKDGVLYLPKANPESSLVRWLKRQALSLLTQRTMYWQEKMGVACKGIKISSARRKWGSCSSKDEIRYVYRLLYAPIEIIDYVVVHELAHIRYKNHSAAFWQEVSAYLPDCRQRRAWLQQRAVLLEIF